MSPGGSTFSAIIVITGLITNMNITHADKSGKHPNFIYSLKIDIESFSCEDSRITIDSVITAKVHEKE